VEDHSGRRPTRQLSPSRERMGLDLMGISHRPNHDATEPIRPQDIPEFSSSEFIQRFWVVFGVGLRDYSKFPS
jgi:hypothetical protein